jgi:hypothetical protein
MSGNAQLSEQVGFQEVAVILLLKPSQNLHPESSPLYIALS